MAKLKLKKSGKIIILLLLLALVTFFYVNHVLKVNAFATDLEKYCIQNIDLSELEKKYQFYCEVDNKIEEMAKITSFEYLNFYENSKKSESYICHLTIEPAFSPKNEPLTTQALMLIKAKTDNRFEVKYQIIYDEDNSGDFIGNFFLTDLNDDGASELNIEISSCNVFSCTRRVIVYDLSDNKMKIIWEESGSVFNFAEDEKSYYVSSPYWAEGESRIEAHQYFIYKYSYERDTFILKEKYQTNEKIWREDFENLTEILKNSSAMTLK